MVVATIVIAAATVINLGVAMAVWHEMKRGGIDTHNLASAANDQATSAKSLASAAISQATNTAQLAASASKQADEARAEADNTARLASAAQTQALELSDGVQETSRLAYATETANTATREAMDTQMRPWIGIENPRDVAVDSEDVRFSLSLVNFGATPAIEVMMQPRFLLLPPKNDTYSVFETYKICENSSKIRSDPEHAVDVTVIFPGRDAMTTVEAVARVPDEFAKIPTVYPTLAGCITYSGPNGGVYYTRVVYYISPYIDGPPPFKPPANQKITIRSRALYDVLEAPPK